MNTVNKHREEELVTGRCSMCPGFKDRLQILHPIVQSCPLWTSLGFCFAVVLTIIGWKQMKIYMFLGERTSQLVNLVTLAGSGLFPSLLPVISVVLIISVVSLPHPLRTAYIFSLLNLCRIWVWVSRLFLTQLACFIIQNYKCRETMHNGYKLGRLGWSSC